MKMGLENLLKGVVLLDEEVSIAYKALQRRIPEGSLRHYCKILNLTGMVSATALMAASSLYSNDPYFYKQMLLIGPFYTVDMILTQNINENEKSTDCLDYVQEHNNLDLKAWRFPIFSVGVCFLGLAVYAISNYLLSDGDILSIAKYGSSSAEILILASSMYLKDQDPKSKDPFWKRAYDAVTERVKEYLPQPIPVPVPVHRHAPVEIAASL